MKKFLVAALLAVLLVSFAALLAMPSGGNAAKPAAAQYGKDAPTGPYLDLFACLPSRQPVCPLGSTQATSPANTAFHLNGGWSKGFDSKTSDVTFEVDNDGVILPASFTYKNKVGTWWVRNFPDGLTTGTHVLTIHYVGCPSTPGPISESSAWNGCTLSMEVTFS
jgi:hypothetical protein